jgi:hypothetical protein
MQPVASAPVKVLTSGQLRHPGTATPFSERSSHGTTEARSSSPSTEVLGSNLLPARNQPNRRLVPHYGVGLPLSGGATHVQTAAGIRGLRDHRACRGMAAHGHQTRPPVANCSPSTAHDEASLGALPSLPARTVPPPALTRRLSLSCGFARRKALSPSFGGHADRSAAQRESFAATMMSVHRCFPITPPHKRGSVPSASSRLGLRVVLT